jgi:hypothetical protein
MAPRIIAADARQVDAFFVFAYAQNLPARRCISS